MATLTAREEVALRLLPAMIGTRVGAIQNDNDRMELCDEALRLADVFLVASGRDGRAPEPLKTDVKQEMRRRG